MTDSDLARLAVLASGDLFIEWQAGRNTVHLFPRGDLLDSRFGPGETDVSGEALVRLVHPEDVPNLIRALGDAAGADNTFRLELRLLPGAEPPRCFLVRGRISSAEAGSVRVVAALTDISLESADRKQLRDRAERFESAEAIAGLGTWDYDILNDTGNYDDSLRCLLGLTADHLDFGDFISHVHPDDHTAIKRAFRLAATEARPYTLELRVFAPAGLRWFEARATVETDPLGRPARVRGIALDITQRKQHEETIELYADVVKRTPIGVCVWAFDDVDDTETLKLRAINAAASAIAGRPVEETLGKTMRELFPTLLETNFSRTCQDAVRNGTSHELFVFPHTDARIGKRIFSVRVFPLPAQSAGVLFEDLTEQARAYEELAESEERFRRFAEETDDVFWFMEVSPPRFSYVSPAFERLSGIPASEAYAEPERWLRAMHPDDVDRVLRTFVAAAKKGMRETTAFSLDFRVVRGPEDVRWVRSRGVVTPGRNGARARASGFAEDITWRKQTEDSLRLLADVSAALGTTLDSTSALQRVADLAVPTLADGVVIELVEGGETRRVAAAGLDATLDKVTTAALPIEIRGEHSGALILHYEAPRQMGPSEQGIADELTRRAAAAVDNANLYRNAQAAVRQRDEFLSVASHELRTPLATLRLAIQKLLSPAPLSSPDGRSRVLQTADRQVTRLTALVDDLLSISRIQKGALALDREEVDLVAVVEEVVQRMRPLAERAGSNLTFRGEPGGVSGYWDAAWLDYVATSLLSNAIKFGAKLPIEVVVARDGESGHLTVRDEGIGISLDRLPFIFDRFARAVSTREYGGLGLGLYLARGIVEAHGGTVRVESKFGHGSTFSVTLPRSPPDRNPPE